VAALNFVSVYECNFRKAPLKIRLQLAAVERGLPGAVDTDNQMKAEPIGVAGVDPSSSLRTSDPSTTDRRIQLSLSAKLRPTLRSLRRAPTQA